MMEFTETMLHNRKLAKRLYKTVKYPLKLAWKTAKFIKPLTPEARILYKDIKKIGSFDAKYYLATYKDLGIYKYLPLRHYVKYGKNEGRIIKPMIVKSKVKKVLQRIISHPRIKQIAKKIFYKLPIPFATRLKLLRFKSNILQHDICQENGANSNKISFEVEFNKQIPDAESISITTSDKPQISIIIPIYGKCEYTLKCLHSISKNPPSVPFETIVIDDKSPDNSRQVLKKVKGIRLIENKSNLGFLKSCNFAATVAKGQYLYFLNNDTQLCPDAIDSLLKTFYDFPGTGLVGSKLIYPDGRLQEAGGIIWQDGSTWNFGKFQDPCLPVYNYAREVDYCSGASIMVPKSLFDELGGFDERYTPAYCEDSDLALKIRDKGYRVIYQPMSTIVHHVSCDTDMTQEVKARQIENSKKLYERWKGRLQIHQPNGVDVNKAKDRRAAKSVLFLDTFTPTPDKDAGSVTVLNIMLLFRDMNFHVTFIPLFNNLYVPEYTSILQCRGIEVLFAPHYASLESHMKEYGSAYNLVFIFRPNFTINAISFTRKYCPKAKILYHTIDLHYLRMEREAALLNDTVKLEEAKIMKQTEFTIMNSVDAFIVHSFVEYEILHHELPNNKIYVFPLILDVAEKIVSFDERHDLVFVGGYSHLPNLDAVKFFVNDIMPLVRTKLPDVRLYVVGSNPTEEILSLGCQDIIVVGFVKDISSMLDMARISVCPLRYGAGIKGKIGLSLASGLPSITSSIAAEGMGVENGKNILIADDPNAFANLIAGLYNDKQLWESLSSNGIKLAKELWGKEKAYLILNGILKDIGIECQKVPYELSVYRPSKNAKDQIPFVSIIIPAFNHENYIEQTIRSALSQSYPFIEIVIIDDGSTDQTLAICKDYESKYSNIIKVFHQENQGAHNAINYGISLSQGEYIAILNSDDYFEPDKIKNCINILQKDKEINLIFGKVRFVDDLDNILGDTISTRWYSQALDGFNKSNCLPLSILCENFVVTTSNIFFPKKIWEENNGFQPLRYCHDVEFLISILAKGKYFFDKETIHISYRVHQKNTIKETFAKVQIELASIFAYFISLYNKGSFNDIKFSKIIDTVNQKKILDYIKFFSSVFSAFNYKKDFFDFASNEETKSALIRATESNDYSECDKLKKVLFTDNKINILIEIDTFDKGGLQKVVLDSAVRFDKDKLTVVIISVGKIGLLAEDAVKHGISVYKLPDSNSEIFYELILRFHNIHIACSHFSDFGYKIFKKLNIPNITFIHNVYAFLTGLPLKNFIDNDTYVNHYISVSNKATKYAVERLGINPTKVTTIANGLIIEEHLVRMKNAKPYSREIFGLSDSDYVFLNVASYNLHKGHYVMIDAMKKILQTRSDIKILCIGNVIYEPHYIELLDYLKKTGLDKYIILPGYYSDIESIYPIVDAFLMPSFIEGWSIAMNEAMFYKKPLIMTDTGGAAEVIENNDIGILIENEYGDITNLYSEYLDKMAYEQKQYKIAAQLANAMIEFANHREKWKKAGEKGYSKIIKQYNFDDVVKSYENIFCEVLNKCQTN